MTKLIIHSKTYGEKEVLFDDKFKPIIEQYQWHLKSEDNGNFYAMTNIANTAITMHRFLYPYYKIIDHINGNGLDNREENLRNTDSNWNNKNKLQRKTEWSSKYKGVQKREGGWIAQINHNNKRLYLGKFSNEIAAATAYNVEARKLFGEFCNLNKIEEIKNYKDYLKSLSSSSKYKNVSYCKKRKKWIAQIYREGKHYKLGRFETEEEAYLTIQEFKKKNGWPL